MKMYAELTSSMSIREKYNSRLSTVKIRGLDTNWRPLENNMRFSARLEG